VPDLFNSVGMLRCRLRCVLIVTMLWACVTGCATKPEFTEEDRVAARALEWAEALMDLDFDKALTFMTPSYRNSPRAERFQGEFMGASFWHAAELKWVKCDAIEGYQRCAVRLIITFSRPPEISTPIPIPYDTTWLFLQDDWFQYRD